MTKLDDFLTEIEIHPEDRDFIEGVIKKWLSFVGSSKRRYTKEEAKERAKQRSQEQYKKKREKK